jgi:hypothetical protein
MPKGKPKSKSRVLKGWGEIGAFLGQTTAVAQRCCNIAITLIEGHSILSRVNEYKRLLTTVMTAEQA